MSNTKTVVLAVVAVVLVLGVCFFVSINPWVSAGLAPVLLAIAAILRAVSGNGDDVDEETGTAKTGNEKVSKGTKASVSPRGDKVLEDDVAQDEEATAPGETISDDEVMNDEKDEDIEKS